ncbi:hypothetical protein OU798_19070 [Prolixibacteraceae bacterium Z1-6]|uniref:Glycoside hydrolase family 38 N-terminal domain-containing protein n=1 Tax=Draconibacterium aestuarii TaxID=2998507 RepID=A0A9X3J6B4_9BACT|nr:hypothetical protein [Prolixibacteraceae bacterium Z1-6]
MKSKAIIFCLLMLGIADISFAQENSRQSQLEEVIVVFKTHFDIGYTDWAANVSDKYASDMVEGALKIIDQSKELPGNEQFRWTVSGWPMKEMLAKSSPETKARIEQAVEDGNFRIHSMPFTFETEACDLESMVRSLSYSTKIHEEAGLALPIDAKQTDVPGHSWILPTLLNNAGIKFLHIGCNPASKSPEVPLLFWWEGPDKSRVMTMYFGPYYGTSSAPPENWPYKTWIAIVHTNDNTGAPSYAEFKEALEEVKSKNPGAKIRTGSIGDFYTSLMKENPDLPVVKGDMPDTWIHGYMSMPGEVKTSRALGKDIFNLEALNTFGELWGISSNKKTAEIIGNATENIHLFNEHTFGLAMSHGHGGYWAYNDEYEYLRAKGFYEPIEFSWKEKSQRVANAEMMIKPAVHQKMKDLAAAVHAEGKRIVVYNPLPWERSGLVTIQTNHEIKGSLKNLQDNNIVSFSKNKNIIQFFANNVPAMGYTTFVPVETEVKTRTETLSANEKTGTIENEFFSITIDKETGSVISLIDKKSGKEVVSRNSEWNFGQYVYERFSKEITDKYAHDYIKAGWHWAYAELGRINLTDKPYKKLSGSQPKINFREDEISVSAVMHFEPKKELNQKYSVLLTLYKNQPFVELIWSINGKPADAWPEAGWISFPFNINNPEFLLGRTGGIVNPAEDFIKGSNFDYCFLNSGMALIDSENKGFGIMSPDVPGVSLERPGLWKYSTDFVPQKGNVFFNLYNNQWSTNFTEWIEGSWNTRFYLWSIDNYDNEKSVITPSEEFRNPLMAEFTETEAGDLPTYKQGISISEKGIFISAFKKGEAGKEDLIRFWEQAGKDSKCQVKLLQNSVYRWAQPVNLRGEKEGEKTPVINNMFEFDIKSNQPKTFLLID